MSGTNLPVVIVTHVGASERLTACVRSVEAAGGADPIVVVDNSGGSSADHPSRSTVEVVTVPNDGFGAAVNSGIAAARRLSPDATAIAVLNDDIEVTPNWLEPLSAAVDAGWHVAQPKLLLSGADGADEPRVNSMGVHLDATGAGNDIGYGEIDGPAFGEPVTIDIFTGGAALYSTTFLELTGGFDERYFLYYEDVDLALRGGELGCRYRCVPQSVVWHEGGATTATLGPETRRLQERNRLWCAARFATAAALSRGVWLSVRRLRHQPRRVHASALFSGLAGVPVRRWERWRARRDLGTTS